MYKDAEQQQKEQQIKKEDNVKLGKVTSITSGGMPKVTINGSTSESVKVYPCLNSYEPKVNDTVLMQKQGFTYVILGAIENDSLNSDNSSRYALVDHNHDNLYAAIGHNHDSSYATKTHNHDSSYAAKAHNHDSSYAATSHTHEYIRAATALSTPVQVKVNYYSSRQYFDGSSTATGTVSKSYQMALVPNATENYALGTSSYKWMVGWIQNIFASYLGSYKAKITAAHITNMYGTYTAQSSDRRIKGNIENLGPKYKALFEKLRPVSFKFTDGSSDKTHTGFIAQEVEEALNEVGLEDIGIVTKDEGESYYLNYIEFIAIQTQMIKGLQERVDKLETKLSNMENDNK